ncbi:MAG: hypothetical protein LBR36_08635, partial [Bacteroidales bacterium]|nr:hypothetical protein [Bacteroidales bacterium]
TVNAGDKSKRIYVTQKGKKDCSNNPKTRDIWGLTVGYAHNHHSNKYAKYGYGYYGYDTSHYMPNGSSHGMQIGIRAEPLFKYGFGLNTGVYADFYFNDLWAINIPLHFEYRGNFSKWFSMFAYCGLGANFVADYALNTYLIPINLEYGGGFRINHVQFNIGSELNLWDLSWQNGAFQRKLIVSISYMF